MTNWELSTATLASPTYTQFLYGYSLGAVTIVSILAIGGLYFRWLALEQEAKMQEFDMLLDALGVPLEGDDPEEQATNGRDDP